MDILLIYLLIINAISLTLMLIDKRNAKKKLFRIPESVLLSSAVAGGSLGVILGMRMAHHKTKKPRFYIDVPIILAMQVIVFVIICTL